MKNRNYLRKKKIVSVMLAAILTASSFQSVYAENSAESERRASGEASLESIVADEILVVYDDAGVSDKKSEQIQKEAEESLADKEIQVTEEVAPSEDGQGTVVTADIPEDMDVEEAVEMAMEEESVVHAQPNYIYKTMENDVETVPEEGLDDTYVKKGAAYYLDNANVKAAWNAMDYGNKDEAGGEETEVTVAVLDTGCRMDHEDLVGNISDKAYDVYENEPLTASSTPNGGDVAGGSNEGHGTHVCGLIAAEANNGKGIAGVSYNATPLPVKIFDDSGEGATTATVLAGLKYCQELIESGEVENLHVINMSVGTYSDGTNGTDALVESQISLLADDYEVLCVCSGGNGDEVTRQPLTLPMYPSDFDVCLSVTSLDKNGDNSVWSDYNQSKDISAPGERIISTWCRDNAPYTYMTGTSMAAPIVSGICALLWTADPSLTAGEVKEAVTNTAVPVKSNATDGREGKTGSAGAVDAEAALRYVTEEEETGKRTSIETAEVTFAESSYTYLGKRIQPEVTVVIDGETLVKGEDYKVGYSNNLNVGTAKAQIQGINEYRGTISKSFEIKKRKISESSYSISAKEIPYTGREIKPNIRLRYNGKTLVLGTDYTLEYQDNVNVGEASIYVSGTGQNFTGRGRIPFRITKANISEMTVSLSSTSYIYNGKIKTPSVTVKDSSGTKLGTGNYTVTYTGGRKNVGKYTVTVTMKGNYTGSETKTFKIVPKGTKLSSVKAGKKKAVVKWKKQTKKTSGYQIQYSTKKNFSTGVKTKTVKGSKKTSLTVKKLKSKKTYYVRVRTWRKASGGKYYSSWSKAKKVKIK